MRQKCSIWRNTMSKPFSAYIQPFLRSIEFRAYLASKPIFQLENKFDQLIYMLRPCDSELLN